MAAAAGRGGGRGLKRGLDAARGREETAAAVAARRLQLSAELARMQFPSAAYTYHPLEYAGEVWQNYVGAYGGRKGVVMLVGMNPGPWGMAQTGVPFGLPSVVSGFLELDGTVGKPEREHPKRPVEGFACKRKEVSGTRLWLDWVQADYGTAEAFSQDFFVDNYCPAVWMQASGANITPNKLAREERDALIAKCDAAMADVIRLVEPVHLIGIGKWTHARLEKVAAGMDFEDFAQGAPVVGSVLHPSPASPQANQPPGWVAKMKAQLVALGVPVR